ncbi:CHAT domain-containing protein [Anaerolineales bacterium HSG24]|nr:CHAT domain-containing protein [Anaerolineales bacterium HSG24]
MKVTPNTSEVCCFPRRCLSVYQHYKNNPQAMHILELTIQPQTGDHYLVVADYTPAKTLLPTRHEGELRLDLNSLISCTTAEEYGKLLGQALFQGDIKSAFLLAQQQAQPTFRLLLLIEDPELRTLHWERLQAPHGNGWQSLTFNQHILYSRYLPTQTVGSFPPIGRRNLRALVVVASPQGLSTYSLTPFDEATIAQGVETALGKIPHDLLANLPQAMGAPTLENLCYHLSQTPYTLLHIVAHGVYNRRKQETALFLQKTEPTNGNAVARVTGERFLEQLSHVKHQPYFTFLSACDSADPSAEAGLGGLGHRLVRELGLPAVLAMTNTVSIKTATELAHNFYPNLLQHGEVDLALAESLINLTGRYDSTVPTIFSRLAGRPLFSDQLDRELTNQEIAEALTELAEYVEQRAPILSTIYQTQANLIQPTLTTSDDALSPTAKTERQNALTDINALCEEVLDISFNALALGTTPPDYDSDCPFMGLHKFEGKHTKYFFGRNTLVNTLTDKLQQASFLAVLGPSGSGKSSLVLAGLIPALAKTEASLRAVIFTPTQNPQQQLTTMLQSVENPTLIVVDQFEEAFTLCTEKTVREQFFDQLLALAEHPNKKVVITMRADFWGDCASYPALKEAMQTNQELVGPMNRDELRSAMEQQAQQVGLRFEADLSNTILDDVDGEPGAMPLLQHALLELWERRYGRWLKSVEYRENMGSVRKSIARTADTLYNTLKTAKERAIVQTIFLDLTRLDEQKTGSQTNYRDTRQRVQIDKLATNFSATKTRELVHQLANARLISTITDEVSQRNDKPVYVEVAHEALIRHWPRLQEWIEEDREFLLWEQRLDNYYRQWENADFDDGDVLTGSFLEKSEEYLQERFNNLDDSQRRFIKVSIDSKEKVEWRNRRNIISVIILTFALLVAGVVVWYVQGQQQLAETARATAEAERNRSEGLQLAFAAQNQYDENHELALLLAIEGWNKTQDILTDSAIRQYFSHAGRTIQLITNTHRIRQGVWSPNDKYLAIAGDDANIRLLSATGDKEIGVLSGHTKPIKQLIWNSTGEILASVSDDTTARLWQVEKQTSQLLEGHYQGIVTVAWNNDETLLATGSADRSARIWDIKTGKQIQQFEHGDMVNQLMWHPTKNLLATASYDQMVRVWNIDTGDIIAEFSHQMAVYDVEWSPDGEYLVTASDYKTAKVWAIGISEPLLILPHADTVSQATWWANGSQIVTVSDNTAKLWQLVSVEGRFVEAVDIVTMPHYGKVTQFASSMNGEMIVTVNNDNNTAQVWDVVNRQQLAVLTGHTQPITSARWDNQDRYIVTTSEDNTVRIWDTFPNKEKALFTGHESGVNYLVWSGNQLISGGDDGTVRMWDINSGQELAKLDIHQDDINHIALDPTAQFMITASEDDRAMVWDITTPQPAPIATLDHTWSVKQGIWHPTEPNMALTASDDGLTKLWDVTTPEVMVEFPFNAPSRPTRVKQIAWNYDGSYLLIGKQDHTIDLWQMTPVYTQRTTIPSNFAGNILNAQQMSWSHTDNRYAFATQAFTIGIQTVGDSPTISLNDHTDVINYLDWSYDDTYLASASRDGQAIIWTAQTGKIEQQLIHPSGIDVKQVVWHPQLNMVATNGSDNIVRIWNTETGAEMAQLEGHHNRINHIAWNEAGNYLATASDDGTIRVYYALSDQLKEAACELAVRNMNQSEWQRYMETEPYRETCPQ